MSAPADILLALASAALAILALRPLGQATTPGHTLVSLVGPGLGAIAAALFVASAVVAALESGAEGPVRLAGALFLAGAIVGTWAATRSDGGAAFAALHRRGDQQGVAALQAANLELTAEKADRDRRLAETTRRFETALKGSGVTVFQQDTELRYTSVYNPRPGFEAMVGRTDGDIFPEPARTVIEPLKRQVLATGEAAEGEFQLADGERPRWFKLRVEPLDFSRAVGLTSVAVDITEEKENEQHLRSLLRELTHRSRNLLAVIQGIARRTAASSHSLDGFLDRFSARVQALAAAHDILVDRAWRGASIREIAEVQLAPIESLGTRVRLDGEPLMLTPDAAQHMSLALHELVTNALEHGALSDPAGRVTVSWGPAADEAGTIELVWSEEGGPPVREPSRFGFGTVVLDRLVPHGLTGTGKTEFRPEGVRWTLRFPASNLIEREAVA